MLKKTTKKIFFIIIFILIINLNNNIFAAQYKNITKAYFLSETTNGYGNGDCILLENSDSSGQVHYGLIDAGREIKTKDSNGKDSTKIIDFLKAHMKTNQLDFIIITHSHGDHNGDAVNIINNFNVKKIYMKEYDNIYSCNDGWQWKYEEIIKAIVNNNVNIIGCNYETLISKEINPSTSSSFIEFLNSNSAKKILFNKFDENNTKFDFGSSKIEILNWEFFKKDGSVWKYGDNIQDRELVENENNNSLGILLTQGNKKAFFSGDINNYDKDNNLNKLGDEDRLKDKIGDIDLLKLGHHGYSGSNTDEYLNILKPEYAVITNDVSGAYKNTIDWLEKNNTEYLYTTVDEKALIATITNENVSLNFETIEQIKRINKKLVYIGKNTTGESDWKKLLYEIEFNEVQEEANSWNEIEEKIIGNKNNIIVDNENKKITITKLKLFVDNNIIANKTIQIEKNQFVTILSKNNNDVNIVRDSSFINQFFNVKGKLNIGNNNLQYRIVLDGNKENVNSKAPIIVVENGILNIYNGVIIKNNSHIVTNNDNLEGKYDVKACDAYSSGILVKKESIFNMYGGEICGNIIDNKKEIAFENTNTEHYYNLLSYGAGIFVNQNSIFNMYGGKISENTVYNNSKITINNSKYKKNRGFKQNIQGVGVYLTSSKINIEKGEISNNRAINNSEISINSSEIYSNNNTILGVGIYLYDSDVKIKKLVLTNNIGTNSSKVGIIDSKIATDCASIIDGAGMYLNKCNSEILNSLIEQNKALNNADLNINNSQINNTNTSPHSAAICAVNNSIQIIGSTLENNTVENNTKIKIEDNSSVKSANNSARGGAIYFNGINAYLKNSRIQNNTAINNIYFEKSEDSKINTEKKSFGGGIYTYIVSLNIDNCIIENNSSSFGGGIYISDNNSVTRISNTQILNNKATAGSGGGIYAFGKIFIIGGKNKIYNNNAKTYGGGIIVKNIGIIENSEICDNIAESNSGGGIRVDDILLISSSIIKNNKAKETGGGIDYTSGTLINKSCTISDNVLLNNVSSNIYPTTNTTESVETTNENTNQNSSTQNNIEQNNSTEEKEEIKEVTNETNNIESEKNNQNNSEKSTEDKETDTQAISNIEKTEGTQDKSDNSTDNDLNTTNEVIDRNNTDTSEQNIKDQNQENIQNNVENSKDTSKEKQQESSKIQDSTENEETENLEENNNDEEEQILKNADNIESDEEETELNYINDNQAYKTMQDALSSDMPKTGQNSLTVIFIVLGIIAIKNYIELIKYKEIL